MSNLSIKRWVSIMVAVAFLVQASSPLTFAQDGGSDENATTNASEETDANDEGANDEGANDDTSIDEQTDEENDDSVKIEPARLDAAITDKLKRIRQPRRLFQIRWGVLNKGVEARCPGLDASEIRTALAAGETPDCGATQADYEGSLKVSSGSLKVKKEILFEKNDEVTTDEGSSIEWSSHIAGHWDGMLVEFTPDENTDKATVTLSIGNLNDTFQASELIGQKEIGNGHMVEVKPLIVALAGRDNDNEDKVVENKLRVEDKISKFREFLRKLKLVRKLVGSDVTTETDELDDVLTEIEGYNFDSVGSGKISDLIEELLNKINDGASKEEIKNIIKELREKFRAIKERAKDRKFSEKLIPFKDTDDDQWYTDYVATVKDLGIVNGYKDANGNETGYYGPGDNVTVGEILKIGLKSANKGEGSGTPRLSRALNHWARGYVKRAEDLNLDLVKDQNTDLNRPATRGEVIRMMLEAAGIEPEDISSTSFSDVSLSNVYAKFIEYATKLGIVSGDDNASTFRPDDSINRAEVAKITKKILEYLMKQQSN
jgi:hypothetical protein